MTLTRHLTQQSFWPSQTYSNLFSAAESFARDFNKNLTKNSDNTAQVCFANKFKDQITKMPRVFIYSIALSQGSRLHSCVHTPPPPPLLMLLQTLLVRKQPENQQGPASAFWRWLLECTSKDSFLLLLSLCFILIPGRTVLNFHSFVLFHFCLEHEKDTCTGPALAGELLLLLLT